MRTSPRAMRRPTWVLLLLIALVVLIQLFQSRRPAPIEPSSEPSSRSSASVEATREADSPATQGGLGASVGFRSRQRLMEHFEKHGHEFRVADAAAYLALAQALRDGPVGGPVLEAVRSDGVITRFDQRDGTFIAFDDDGTLRTCFRPNDGERYFRRQARRPAGRP